MYRLQAVNYPVLNKFLSLNYEGQVKAGSLKSCPKNRLPVFVAIKNCKVDQMDLFLSMTEEKVTRLRKTSVLLVVIWSVETLSKII